MNEYLRNRDQVRKLINLFRKIVTQTFKNIWEKKCFAFYIALPSKDSCKGQLQKEWVFLFVCFPGLDGRFMW